MLTQRSGYVFLKARILFCFSLFIIPILYFLYSLALVFFISTNDRDYILKWYSIHWPNAFDKETIGQDCFTLQWYDFIQAHHLLLIIFILVGLLVYLLFSKKILIFFNELLNEIRRIILFMIKTFVDCTRKEKIFVLILFSCIFIYRIYFFVSYPLLPDELCSYLYFAKQGILITAISYPFPNNHVLYNLACAVLSHLHFLSPALVMRLPGMIGDFFLFWGIFCLFKRFGNFQRAFVVVAGTAFCYILSFYATQGRGYQWQEICAFISLAGCWAWFFSSAWSLRFGYSLFLFASIIGFYINPGFAYPFLALMLMIFFLLIKRKEYRKTIIFSRSILVIFSAVLLLYLPLIIGSSWHALMSNSFVNAGKSLHELIDTYPNFHFALNYIFNLSRYGIFIIAALIVFCLYLYFSKKVKGYYYDYTLIYFIATIFSFLVLILYKKIYPYERLLCFWVLFLNIIFLNVCFDFLKKYFQKNASLLIGIFVFFKILISVRLLYFDKDSIQNQGGVKIYYGLQKDFQQLSSLHPASWQITNSDDFYSMYLRLFLQKNSPADKIIFDRKTAIGDVIFLPNTYQQMISQKGYLKWAENKQTQKGESIAIYISSSLLKTP